MSDAMSTPDDFETRLKAALQPVEPPEHLADRLERTLVSLTEIAADELESWEISSMRDPRNWVRPVVATVIGATAGTGLVVLRVRGRHRRRKAQSHGPIDLAERTVRDLADEARRLIPRP